ncbi:hypothetical protein C2S53_017535 [Perilla frutescens var. hirtella]|uniref:Uncharacterized protein n=1 Tax=Perilla frutescens var. hirtella TaxID=608512 RepID=A0AAD4P8Q4_PERFH|nr:hypothetical protein C2S53_017535 [Perilla frutescens var. hirtella]
MDMALAPCSKLLPTAASCGRRHRTLYPSYNDLLLHTLEFHTVISSNSRRKPLSCRPPPPSPLIAPICTILPVPP